ncbi:hypothetical protein QE152_g12990 [Popillia japonica]|uniref:ISXO2-like transposase domain-containing protein n=1 Tax=Popillia japonica TaxID=7064 RepID=A0AAW1LCS7_POPJA
MGTCVGFGRHKQDDAAGIRCYSSEENSRNTKGGRRVLVYHVDVRSHLCTDMWAAYRNMDRTFRGHVDVRSHLCTDMWAAYRNMDRTFRGHSTVNHRTNFVVPAREQDPHWVPVGRFNESIIVQTLWSLHANKIRIGCQSVDLTRHVWTEE